MHNDALVWRALLVAKSGAERPKRRSTNEWRNVDERVEERFEERVEVLVEFDSLGVGWRSLCGAGTTCQ